MTNRLIFGLISLTSVLPISARADVFDFFSDTVDSVRNGVDRVVNGSQDEWLPTGDGRWYHRVTGQIWNGSNGEESNRSVLGRINDVSDATGISDVRRGISDVIGGTRREVDRLANGASAYEQSCARGFCDPNLLTVRDLGNMNEHQLRYVYCNAYSYAVPEGMSTDRQVTRPSSVFLSEFVEFQWERKYFSGGVHYNMDRFGRYFGKGAVNVGQSLYSEMACGAPFGQGYAVIVDYGAYPSENTSIVNRLRDEFREVAPCLYVGVGLLLSKENVQADYNFRRAYNGLRDARMYKFGVFVAMDFRPNGQPVSGGSRQCQGGW